MEIKFIAIFFVLVFFTFFIEDSYGNVAPREHHSLPEVSLQLSLRNSDDQLVAYVEPTLMYVRNISGIHEFLDGINNKTLITKDGKNYEILEFERKEHFKSIGQIAGYGLVYKGDIVLQFRHDGYIASPGDTLTIHWKITRTVN